MITLSYKGNDEWNRLVFIGDNGRYYKTTELRRDEDFESLPAEEQYALLKSLHTADSPDGEPDFPCWKEDKFTIANNSAPCGKPIEPGMCQDCLGDGCRPC